MDAPSFENLDLACARAGKDIAAKPTKELENLITEAIAVVEEQGIYALFLFLKTRSGKDRERAKNVSRNLHEFLKVTPQQTPLLSGDTDIFASLQKIATDLDKLLLARELVLQALVYARYHARLREESEERHFSSACRRRAR